MKVAICRMPAGAVAARAASASVPGGAWVQFGEEMLLLAEAGQWDQVSERAGAQGLQLREPPRDVRKEDLHLVVQKGRLFQQEHPEVPVILDRGRFLVVDLDPERARQFDRGDEPSYSLMPLEGNQVVFDVPPLAGRRAAPVPWIQDLVARIERESFEADLTHLVSFHTRFSTSADYAAAAAWAKQQLEAMGYGVEVTAVAVGGGTSRNVIAEKPGAGPPPAPAGRGAVLVTAHLDSVNHAGGPAARAPGADDNGSGSAGLLAIARALQDHEGVHDLRFLLFGGEEQGLHGSIQYVTSLAPAERTRIRAVVNMDMIGTLNTVAPTVLLEGAALSQAVIDGLATAAASYTQLAVQTSLNPFNSDHVPFIQAGIPTVLTIEGADGANENVHSGSDTLDHIDDDLALEILRMNVAFVADAVGRPA